MNEIVEYQLEWKFSPQKYIEEPIELKEVGFELIIEDGKVLAKIEPQFFENKSDVDNYFDQKIKNYFMLFKLQPIKILL